jgi:hypothetical protein
MSASKRPSLASRPSFVACARLAPRIRPGRLSSTCGLPSSTSSTSASTPTTRKRSGRMNTGRRRPRRRQKLRDASIAQSLSRPADVTEARRQSGRSSSRPGFRTVRPSLPARARARRRSRGLSRRPVGARAAAARDLEGEARMILVALLRLAGRVTAGRLPGAVPPRGLDGVNAPLAQAR